MAEPVALKYRALFSYSHRDKAWCEWLHRALEGFRIDKDLVLTANARRSSPADSASDLPRPRGFLRRLFAVPQSIAALEAFACWNRQTTVPRKVDDSLQDEVSRGK